MPENGLTPPEDVPPASAEELVDGQLREGEPAERTYPSTIGGAFYLLLLVVAAVGLGIVVLGPWRTGVRTFASVLLVAAGVRLLLPARDAGMLAVRSKPVDAGLLVAVGVALLVLASSIPDQPA